MLGELLSTNGLSIILVFLEGIISFFSPCIIPLIPVYISYLAGSAEYIDEQGNISYKRKKVFFQTFFCFRYLYCFFLLGLTFTTLGTFQEIKYYLQG